MIRVARNSMLQVAGNFTRYSYVHLFMPLTYDSTQYWMGRKLITDDMQDILAANVQSTIMCTVENFQLLHVELPAAYEASIIATQVQQQQVLPTTIFIY